MFFQIPQYSLLFGIWWHLKCNQPVFQSQKKQPTKQNPKPKSSIYCWDSHKNTQRDEELLYTICLGAQWKDTVRVEMENVRKHGIVCNQCVINAGFCKRPSEGLTEKESLIPIHCCIMITQRRRRWGNNYLAFKPDLEPGKLL